MDDNSEDVGSKCKPAIYATLKRRLHQLQQRGEERQVLKMTPFDFEFTNTMDIPYLLNQMEKKDDFSMYVQGSQDRDTIEGGDTDRSKPFNSFPKRQLARTTKNFQNDKRKITGVFEVVGSRHGSPKVEKILLEDKTK